MNMLSLRAVPKYCAGRLFDRLYHKGGRDTSHIIVFSVIGVLVSSLIVVAFMPSANFVFFPINLIRIWFTSLIELGTLLGITLQSMSAYHLSSYVFSDQILFSLVLPVALICGVNFQLIRSYTCGICLKE
jgi:hypothetical protein